MKRWLGKTEKSLSQMPKHFDSPFKAQQAKTDLRKLKHELGPKQVELDALIAKGSKMKTDSTPVYEEEGWLKFDLQSDFHYFDLICFEPPNSPPQLRGHVTFVTRVNVAQKNLLLIL